MPSLKNFNTQFRPWAPQSTVGQLPTSGRIAGITPDEDDQQWITFIQSPGTNNAYYFTGTPSGVGNTIGTPNVMADYPRNVLASIPGTQVGGTLTVYGKDQFGYPQQEQIVVAVAAGGGTASGSKIFMSVGSVSWGEQGTGLGTLKVGYAVGTGAAGTAAGHFFGLQTKISGTADVVGVTWLNGTVSTVYTQPWAAVTGSPNFTFQGTHTLLQSDSFYIRLRPTWDNTSATTYLDNAYTAGSKFG